MSDFISGMLRFYINVGMILTLWFLTKLYIRLISESNKSYISKIAFTRNCLTVPEFYYRDKDCLNMSFLELLTNEAYGLGNDLVLDTILQLIVLILLIRNDGLTGINITGEKVFNTGSITSSGALDVDAESVSNFGEISGENVDFDLENLDNFGAIEADDQVVIDIDNGINNGIISAGTEQVSEIVITSSAVSTLSMDSLMMMSTTQTTSLATTLASSSENFNLSHFLVFLLVFFKIKW